MQEKDSEALYNQRRRRKRVGRIRNGIIITITGWIILSMVLIICLFVKLVSLEKKLDRLVVGSSAVSANAYHLNGVPEIDGAVLGDTEQLLDTGQTETEEMGWEKVTPPAVGISDEENLASEGDVHKVYLTFDDGPSGNTEEILDILASYGVKATFFVTGTEDEELVPLYQRIVDEGHMLGMHSYSNKYSVIYQSMEAFEEDYRRLKDYLQENAGVESLYYRFPGGSSNQISNVPMEQLIHFLNTQGTVYFDWNVSAGDASSAYSAAEIVENVTEDVVKYKTSVVLLHDSSDKSTTVEALGPLIEALQGMGAEILPIDEDTQVIQSVKADTVG